MKVRELRGRVHAQLISKSLASRSEHGECVSYATGVVQRRHQVLSETLVERRVLNQFGEFGDELVTVSESKVGRDACIDRSESFLVESLSCRSYRW